ncbi:MAG: Lrp/AsnC family transcriptional regulator [DPANN group archaeon]|nr:Lrp/AsnC family transcriptional regulator [DPANN group archaeon]
MLAYVMISLKNPKEDVIMDKLLEHEEVKEAHIVFGEWDLMAKIESENPESLATFVMENVRNLSEVKLSSTLIVAK